MEFWFLRLQDILYGFFWWAGKQLLKDSLVFQRIRTSNIRWKEIMKVVDDKRSQHSLVPHKLRHSSSLFRRQITSLNPGNRNRSA